MSKSVILFRAALLALATIALCSCQSNKKSISNYEAVKIDLLSSNETTPITSLIKEVHFIPLKMSANKNSFVSVPEKVEFYSGKFYILDRIFAGIKVFDMQGSFINMIGGIGVGPGKYKRVDDFNILNGKIFALVNESRMLQFHTDGKLIGDKRLPFFATQFKVLSPDEYVFFSNYDENPKSGQNNIIYADGDYKIVKKDFPFANKKTPGFTFTGSLFFGGDKLYFSEPFSDTVYSISQSENKPEYVVNFGNRKMPEDVKTNVSILTTKGTPLKYTYLGKGVLNVMNKLFFTYRENNGKVADAIFDTKERKLYKNIPDSNNYISQLYSSPTSMTSDGQFISMISPMTLFNFLKNNPAENIKYVPAILKPGKTLKEPDNSILMLFKI